MFSLVASSGDTTRMNHSLPSTLGDGSQPPVSAVEGQGWGSPAWLQLSAGGGWPNQQAKHMVFRKTLLLEHLLSRSLVVQVYQ